MPAELIWLLSSAPSDIFRRADYVFSPLRAAWFSDDDTDSFICFSSEAPLPHYLILMLSILFFMILRFLSFEILSASRCRFSFFLRQPSSLLILRYMPDAAAQSTADGAFVAYAAAATLFDMLHYY